jgi:di/tricarboxylate transporter
MFMDSDIVIVLIILFAAVVLFATEIVPVDLVAILVMVTLIIFGIITPEEGVTGFSNPATVTVGAMFVLSAGLSKTGAVNTIGARLAALFKRNFTLGVIVLMLFAGLISAFINNTPVVAILIPVVIGAAASAKHSASKLLMPLSFASMFGGVCTLIGTSTNILVSSIAVSYGYDGFSMFEMTPLGLVFFAVGVVYMILAGIPLIPIRRSDIDLTSKFGMRDYLTEIIITEDSPSIGKKVFDAPFVKDLDIDVIAIHRKGLPYDMTSKTVTLQPYDVLKVRCDIDKIKAIKERVGIYLKSDLKFAAEKDTDDNFKFIEAIIPPNSSLEGKTLKEVGFRNKYGATVLAIRHRGKVMREKLTSTELTAGDTLLIEVKEDRLSALRRMEARNMIPFLIISEMGITDFRKGKIIIAVVIIAGIVLAVSLNLLPIMIGALLGSILLVLTRCIDMNEVYDAIDWRIIFLLAGTLSLGVALEKSGAAALLSSFLTDTIGQLGPVAIVSVLYLITTLLTETMSNNASAVLLAPIAIAAANTLGVDHKPFLMAITFAASASFMTPVGYQTNTMIYGAGQYKFADFLKVGTPLNVIFWILATLLIPVFFPF